jgi:AraC-like DNA-binding protein
MIIKSKIRQQKEWLFTEDIPDVYLPGHNISTKRLAIEKYPAKMINYQLSSTGLFVLFSDMRFEDSIQVHTEIEGDAIASQFITFNKTAEKNNWYGRCTHNIRYLPSSTHEYEAKPGIDYNYFLMVLSRDYYFNIINRHSSLHEDFVQEMDKGFEVSFKPEGMTATPEMLRIISELKDMQKTGELLRLHTEAKVMELLICQLEQFQDLDKSFSWKLKSADIEKLEQVRIILENNIVQPPTQKDLAIAVGLNESKLRRGFKEYFAITIHDYSVRLRMEYGRKLLIDERKTIYEAAEITGFSHQNNFSSAFKKYFGISPSDIKK